ncbi:MAG: hypothetical protein JSW46_06365 [Gemmatimonadota bacterium]|nr:MAG: hypothetical protein JSW46_06365 [Gemmatimonadota bacterium]
MKPRLMRHITRLAFTLLLGGCGEELPNTAYHDAQLGIHFDFPGGWRRLDPSELPPGKESLITIEDSSGVASISLVEFDLQAVLGALDTQLMLQLAGEDNVQRGIALFVQLNSTFDEVFQQRYRRYKLIDREWVRKFEDQPAVASDLVFEGQLPDEPMLMWRKATIILVAGQDQKGFIMAYAVPSLLIDDHRDAFEFVEKSWRTIE